MKSGPRRDPPSPEQQRVLEAMPAAIRQARTIARVWGERSPERIRDCEQRACLALLEAAPGWDESRGIPFGGYAWKRVMGAVTDLLSGEVPRSTARAGTVAALDAAEAMRDTSDPFADDDDEALNQLKGQCRALAFARFVGDAGAVTHGRPDDALARAEAIEALRGALRGLTEEETRLIELRYWQGLSWAKVAETLGMHEKYAQRLDDRVRGRLHGDLQARDVCEPPPSEPR